MTGGGAYTTGGGAATAGLTAPKPPKSWLKTAKAPSPNAASPEDPANAGWQTTKDSVATTSTETTVFFIATPRVN